MDKTIACPLCGETMAARKLRGDVFWECSGCSCEVWPYDERVEKAIRKAMQPVRATKKSRGTRRKGRFRTKKPGERFVPWYQRY